MESIRIPYELMLGTLIAENISKTLLSIGSFSYHLLPTLARTKFFIGDRLVRQMTEFRERNVKRPAIKEILRQHLAIRGIRNNAHGNHEITIIISIILDRMLRRSKRLGRTCKLTKNIILISRAGSCISIGNLTNIKLDSETSDEFRHIHFSMLRRFAKMTKNKVYVTESFTNVSLKELGQSISLTQIIDRNTRRSQIHDHLTMSIRLGIDLGNRKTLLTIRKIIELSSRHSTIVILDTETAGRSDTNKRRVTLLRRRQA